MTYYRDNIGNRVLECLNLPIVQRCMELQKLFESCSIRDLHEVFPTIVQSVFGYGSAGLIGWSLRAITTANSDDAFKVLRSFFSPIGPMFQVCYRLLSDAIKFEFNLDVLPYKFVDMLRSGQYSMFYADLVNVDSFQRQVTSLLLNPFDYYILYFVIHATLPLHKMYPAALQVHNERLKTVYFFLNGDYLNMFLPCSPDSVVLPTNVSTTVKAPQPMPVQPLQAPTRSPKYLKIPTSSLYANNATTTVATAQNARNTESSRAHAWRTESVMHFFLDVWLRYDIDEMRDLPSSEFIRVVRILIKQLHYFSSSAQFDQTTMVTLRKAAPSLLRAQIYNFLKSLFSRWPLDNSLSVVLELWLSYIQPWRYAIEWGSKGVPAHQEVPISDRYNSFLADNIVVYTQIFVLILRRFFRLDFSSFNNAVMLHRLMRTISQTTLPKKLYYLEQSLSSNPLAYDSPQRHGHNNRNNSSSGNCEWDNFYQDENYIPLFGVEVQKEVEQFIKTIYMSRINVEHEISMKHLDITEKKNSMGFFKKILTRFFEDTSTQDVSLQDYEMIPELLDFSMKTLSVLFDVDIPSIRIDKTVFREQTNQKRDLTVFDNSDYLDISKLSPSQMKKNVENLKNSIDPALLPIASHECKILVRVLHQLSCQINKMYGEQLENYYNRTDICGKLARLLLYPPMVSKWFDKSGGRSELCEDHLPVRVCLRPLASYTVLGTIVISLLLGQWLWSAPSFGLLMFIVLSVVYNIILALIT